VAIWGPGRYLATRHFGNIGVTFVAVTERPLKKRVKLRPGGMASGLALSREKRYGGADATARSFLPLAPHAGVLL
jgi:hypothetical protein